MNTHLLKIMRTVIHHGRTAIHVVLFFSNHVRCPGLSLRYKFIGRMIVKGLEAEMTRYGAHVPNLRTRGPHG